MQVIHPITWVTSKVVASNIPEDDYDEFSATAVYSSGAYCIVALTHQVFRALTALDGTDNPYPPTDISSASPSWELVGYTNRWRMFDPYTNSQTEGVALDGGGTVIDVTVDASRCDALALLNTNCSRIQLTLYSSGGEVLWEYDSNNDPYALSASFSGSWSEHFRREGRYKTNFYFVFPCWVGALLKIVITSTGPVRCGNAVIGKMKYVGESLLSPKISKTSYSKKVTDDFGQTYLKKGVIVRDIDFVVEVSNGRLDYLNTLFDDLDAVPAVYICDNSTSLQDVFAQVFILYGFYGSFEVVVPNAITSEASIVVKGLL